VAAALSIQVSSQVSVLHGDVAMVKAVVLLITEFGGAGDGAIGWIPVFLPCVSILILFQLEPFGVARCRRSSHSIYRSCLKPSKISVWLHHRGRFSSDPVREGVISGKNPLLCRCQSLFLHYSPAYGDVMKTMVFTGIRNVHRLHPTPLNAKLRHCG
jgi:hypothetical protein